MNYGEVEKLICAAQKPEASFYEQLAAEMDALEPSTHWQTLRPSKPHLVADLETIVKKVAGVIEADSRENARQNLPCQFEYQLIRVSKPMNHIQVLTRFFKKGDPQSIFYGRSIAKVEENKFALWIE